MTDYLLALDQGTTSSRAMVFTEQGTVVVKHQIEFEQIFPKPGWVEHAPEAIWQSVLGSIRTALVQAKLSAGDIAGMGITNQRETTVLWDRLTGEPIYNAIVWQDRRTAPQCAALKAQGHGMRITEKTGLLVDPYFSATKIAWLLDEVSGARARAEQGELAFGTIDTFLLWRLTEGHQHSTDATNASRTMLYNIHTGNWDTELLELLNIPAALLPEVKDNCADFGNTTLFGESMAIGALIGDQQAATVGQGCLKAGMIKSTYGTGCFVLQNTGDKAVVSNNQLLTTITYQIGGQVTYGLEGSIFVAGAVVQWLRDNLGLIEKSSDIEKLVDTVDDNGGVTFIPAFTGLGAPYWNPEVRGALLGLSRGTQPGHIARAALEAVIYQTRDLLEAMQRDGAPAFEELRVDGGMVNNDRLVQGLSDYLNVTVNRPVITETTALGAALLAGLQCGVFDSLDTMAGSVRCEKRFTPTLASVEREAAYAGWTKAITQLIGH